MADTALNPPKRRSEPSEEVSSQDVLDTEYAVAALEEHKREGLELAVKARWIAMPVIMVFLAVVHPEWDVLYYIGILALLCVNGWFMRRIGRVGRSRAELLLIFADLLIMTFGMVVPNPFSPHDLPVAVQYRFDNFIYFFLILAVATLAYSWRTVIAVGTWTAAVWAGALALAWWFSEPFPGLSENAQAAFGFHPDITDFFDPNNFLFQLRAQEMFVFILVAVTLGISARRFDRLLLSNAGLERERANLSRYFSPNVVDRLSKNDEPLKQVRSENVAVLFIDIIGFTRMSAGRDPYDVIELLRGFHGRMEREVFRHHGTLDKYLGDGLMATFGTPTAGKQDATNALACARAMQASLDQWNRERRRQGVSEIHAGIGIHYGETVLGDIGANRLEYAVIGTAVNVAARLENMTRRLEAGIVISDAVHNRVLAEQAGPELLDGFDEHPDQEVRGLGEPMTVWALAQV